MTHPNRQHFKLSDPKQLQQIKNLLSGIFLLNSKPAQALRYSLVDNFEHTLWHRDKLLFKSSQGFELHSADTILLETATPKSPKFWWQFPAGELQNILKDSLGFWSLMPVAEIALSKTLHELLNKDQKIVARVVLTSHKAPAAKTATDYLSLLPLRGYSKEFSRVLKTCRDLLDHPCPEPNLKYLLKQQSLKLKPKNDKTYGLDANSPSEKTIYEMLLHIVTLTQTYKPGIIKDIDTEFLHQYRVHLRQARSLVNLTKQALPENVYLDLKTKLAELANPTGQLRDLDVFLLNQTQYKALLPANFSAGVDQLFSMLQSERQQALKQVNSFLASKKCETLFSEIISLVTMEPQYQHEASRQAIIELAKKRIFKRYQKVCALGSNIKHDTPDDDVHELRIECKKLRYLMEFFSELFTKKPIIALIKAVKELQTILGNFNDYSVQKDFISQYSAKTKSSNLIAAASGFIAVLHQKQLEEKSRVVGAFENFSQQKVAGEFKRLFT